MQIHIPDFTQARILIVGDVMLDRYWYGNTSRISPEAPVPVVKVTQVEERPGGAANVAVNIATLGGKARVLGITGADAATHSLEQKLALVGIESDFLRLEQHATITKLRVLSRHQQLLRMDFEDDFLNLAPTALQSRFTAHLPDANLVVLSDYNKGALANPQNYIDQARAANRPVLVDPKGHDFSSYRGATLITPNLAELETVVGACRNEAELVDKGARLRQDLELEALLITRSDQGMSLLQQDCDPLHLSAQARDVYDVTGAGDTVIASLAAGLAAGLKLPAATALANMAAGIVVGKLGTAGVTVSELRRALYAHDEPPRGVLNTAQLLQAVTDAKAHGETLVMTNGCFDILHAGHVAYLEQARRLGNRLIVAVNDDAGVRRLKGPDRPIHSLQQRMQVLAGLAAVDWVVPFSEDTPEQLICQIKPDYLVKGGDYNIADIAGNRCVQEAGGRVLIMDYKVDCSTSNTIERIRKKDNIY